MASPDRHFANAAIFTHSTGLTPNSGDAALYIKSDNKAYIKDSTGTETAVGSVSAIGASADDVLSVSGSDIVADDPGSDKLIFWDDSESKLTHLEVGSGLSITGTTIAADIKSDPTGVTGADAIANIISLTQAEYDAIATPDAATLYIITD